MTSEQFLFIADVLPEATLLVSAGGRVLAANRACGERFGMAAELLCGRWLHELVCDAPDEIAGYLRSCSRSRQMVVGAIELSVDGKTEACRAEGGLLRPKSQTDEALLLLRLIPKSSAVGKFVALNQRIGQLADEVQRRKRWQTAAQAVDQRFQTFMINSPTMAFIKDAEGRYLFVNRLLEDRYRRPFQDWIGKTDLDLYPPHHAEQYRRNDARVLDSGITARFTETGLLADGLHHFLSFKFPLEDIAGNRLLGGMSLDITEQRRAEDALRASEDQFRRLADALPQIVWAARPDGFVDYFNERWYEFTGFAREQFGQQGWIGILHPDDVRRTVDTYQVCIQQERLYQIEYRFKDRATGGYRWFLGRAVPMRDERGKVVRWFGTCTDIDETKRAEQKLRFLSDASAGLAELRDPAGDWQSLAEAAVPAFADWCSIDLIDGNAAWRRTAVAHVDQDKMPLVRDLVNRHPPGPTDPRGLGRVITGKPELIEDVSESMLSELAPDPRRARLLRELGMKSYIGVPMLVRGRMLGALSFVMADSSRRFDASDLEVAQELAHRAAIAIDNAHLYQALHG